jgi:hypothetical protein
MIYKSASRNGLLNDNKMHEIKVNFPELIKNNNTKSQL